MTMLDRYKQDRAQAFSLKDPMAPVCTVANIGAQGDVQMRTLILRDVGDELAIFVNATSPKWSGLQEKLSCLTYWPTMNLQYRMLATTSPVDPGIVKESWLLRPPAPKKMDWFYSQHAAQSTALDSREALLARVASQELPEPLVAPETARGLIITPYSIERLDLNQDNGIHDRRLATLTEGHWHEQVLVP